MSYKQVLVLWLSIIFGIGVCIAAFFLGRMVIGETIDPTMAATAVSKIPTVIEETEKETILETEAPIETETESELQVGETTEHIVSAEDPNEVYYTLITDYDATVVADELAIRVNSVANAEVIGVLNYGDHIRVTGLVLCNGEDIGWARVEYNGQVGYASSYYLEW